MSTTIKLSDCAATEALGQALARQCQRGDCVALDGPLGAGKTTLVRALVAALGGDSHQVASPTFTLMNSYQAQWPIYHVDAYRLQGKTGLHGLGFDEATEEGIGVVEWSSLVQDWFDPDVTWWVSLSHLADGREASISAPTGRQFEWLPSRFE